MIDGCGNACGLIAAVAGVLGFGTFGAPLKSDAANSVNPDPFVLQTYKSMMCFLTSFLVLGLGEQYHFSPWGILSGFLWVIGGICGIFGIRNSGLAISVGTWSAITVLISFTWGIFVFGERVMSVAGTLLGIWLMISGFWGMAYFSSPRVMEDYEADIQWRLMTEERLRVEQEEREGTNRRRNGERNQDQGAEEGGDNGGNRNENNLMQPLLEDYAKDNRDEEKQLPDTNTNNEQTGTGEDSGSSSPLTFVESDSPDSDIDIDTYGGNDNFADHDGQNNIADTKVKFLGWKWDRWTLGIIGAAMDGIFGGGNLIPMHYSPYKGSEYLISFATGAMIVTIVFWILRWGYNSYEMKSVKKGWCALPSMHLRTLFVPGVFSGTLWSIGNIGQIMCVTYFGESIGMSIVQSSMIVSGFLGIVWFKEVKGVQTIALWSLSAVATFVGIIFLSHQHKA